MYLKNNIDLRKISSLAKSQFLYTEYYYLNEIMSGSFIFDPLSKETLLLNYDLWFKFLVRIERQMIFCRSRIDKSYITLEYKNTFSEIFEVMRDHTDTFGTYEDFTFMYKQCIDGSCDVIDKYMETIETKTINNIYVDLSELITHFMDYQVRVLHELQNVRERLEAPFLSFTEYGNFSNDFGIYLILIRAKLYKQYFNLSEFNLKNYTENDPSKIISVLTENDFIIKDVH